MAVINLNLPTFYNQNDLAFGDFFLRAFDIPPEKEKLTEFFDEFQQAKEQVPKGDLILDESEYVYKDLPPHMKAHPLTGNLTRSYDTEAVKNSIKNIVLTEYGERPFGDLFGSPIKGLLFEPMTDLNGELLRQQIEDAIYNWEPRVELLQVVVLPLVEANQYEILIKFSFRTSNETVEFSFFLERA